MDIETILAKLPADEEQFVVDQIGKAFTSGYMMGATEAVAAVKSSLSDKYPDIDEMISKAVKNNMGKEVVNE